MLNQNAQKMRQVRIRSWFLWGLAFLLIVALTATAYGLHFRLTYFTLEDASGDGLKLYTLGVALWGLIILFVLHTTWKQMQLNGLRDRFTKEEQQLQTLQAHFDEVVQLFRIAFIHKEQIALGSMLDIITHRCVDALRAQHASIMLLDDSGEFLETRSSYGVGNEFAQDAKKRVGEGIGGLVVENKKPMLLPEDDQKTEFSSYAHRCITSAISVPILQGKICTGVLNVNRINFPEAFTRQQMEVLTVFAGHVGTMIETAKRVEELQERSKALEQEKLRLEEFGKVKDVFLSTASHELKTPLTSVIGYAELLSETNLSDAQRDTFLGGLQAEATRLLGLIENILDLTRLETGKTVLRLKPVLFDELVQSALSTIAPIAAKDNLDIKAHYGARDVFLNLDEVQIRQVLVNLLTNAIRYSPEGEVVRIETRLRSDGVSVSVIDRGPGIAHQEQEHIFTLFGQVTREEGGDIHGLGIGLHLVQRIVSLHGGTVSISSSTDSESSGSTFTVHLPLELVTTDDVSAAA